MKQFLYLDTDTINSIIAQKEKGIIKDIKKENTNTKENNNKEDIGASVDCKAEGALFKLAKAEGELNINGKLTLEQNKSNTSKEILEKTLHDASYDIAYEYIKPEIIGINNNEYDDFGNYVELKRVFDVIDIEHLSSLFSKNGVIDYLKKLAEKEIRDRINEEKKELDKEQLRQKNKEINEKEKELIKQSTRNFDESVEILDAFKKIFPYSRMLICEDGYLVPLEEKYFRVNPNTVGFMYGGDITCVGMISNIIGQDTQPNKSNLFSNLQFSLNEVLRTTLPTNEKNICVVKPIAVYYN